MRIVTRLAFALAVLGAIPGMAHAELGKGEAQQIAEEAFVYGFPMVMNYAVFYEYFVDKSSPEYKAPFNQLYNTARVYTPKDTAIVTPNSDTPYSFVGHGPAGRAVRGVQSGDREVRATSRCSSSTCTRSTTATSGAAPPATAPPAT